MVFIVESDFTIKPETVTLVSHLVVKMISDTSPNHVYKSRKISTTGTFKDTFIFDN